MADTSNKRLAVLIDAENAQPLIAAIDRFDVDASNLCDGPATAIVVRDRRKR